VKAEHNELLRAARGRIPSLLAPGGCLSRSELAEAVNAWLWQCTGRRYELDGHHVAKYERGVVRFPIAPYRAALRAVLKVRTDAELGFVAPARLQPSAELALAGGGWALDGILDASDEATRCSLLNRRDAMRSGLVATGASVIGALAAGWLEPFDGWASRGGSHFSVVEVQALEHVVGLFREWHSARSGPGVSAVVGQLGDVTDRLRGAADNPLTGRVFLAAAELAKIAGSMYFDAGAHVSAQRYYVLAVRLAKAAREDSFAATTLAALARQAFDLSAAADGLEIVNLAQHGTRGIATPRLRAMLATRQAWGHAQQGQVYAFHRAVSVAEQSFVDAGQVQSEPRWLAGLDAAELAGVIGARFRDLARHQPAQARHAVTYIERALQLRDPVRVRNRSFDLIGLARAHLVSGEPDRGCELIAEVLPMIDSVRSGRVVRRLGDWSREASRYAGIPVVRETRDRVRELAAD
jgi:hypothetical protein